jgi:hypothetical protein
MTHPDFNPPGDAPKLTGRRSTITGLFFTSLTPYVEPTDEEVDEALGILGMNRGSCVCAYCGGPKSEWDHFRAIVKDRRPTGYITEIANLVPACGKCNQSRGNKDWKTWMLGKSRHSPTTRGIVETEARIKRLEAYESWGKPIKIDYACLAGEEGWRKHIEHLEEVLALLEQAEEHASALRSCAKAFARAPRIDV